MSLNIMDEESYLLEKDARQVWAIRMWRFELEYHFSDFWFVSFGSKVYEKCLKLAITNLKVVWFALLAEIGKEYPQALIYSLKAS